MRFCSRASSLKQQAIGPTEKPVNRPVFAGCLVWPAYNDNVVSNAAAIMLLFLFWK
jgi:hypothetical protein